jgi:hypothetical protein
MGTHSKRVKFVTNVEENPLIVNDSDNRINLVHLHTRFKLATNCHSLFLIRNHKS